MPISLFRKAISKQPAVQPGERIYAVGDVHGRYDLWKKLLRSIDEHQERLPRAKASYVVVLGDIVDRGPESGKVVGHLSSLQDRGSNVVTLLGNHEDMMLRALRREPGLMRAWLRIGGAATLRSYGIDVDAISPDDPSLVDQARKAIPESHIRWLSTLPLSIRSGDYFFCHAGIRPGVALKRQSRSDLLWIRDEFLQDESEHGVVVVHGHSVSADAETRSNRIGIDTGAYRTGVLTALYLEGTEKEFLSVSDAGGATGLPASPALRQATDARQDV